MKRRRLLLVSCALALALAAEGPLTAAFAPHAFAQEGKRDGEKDDEKGKGKGKGKDGKKGEKEPEKEKDPKDTPEGKELAAVGGEFRRKDSAALAARIREKGKLRIQLSDTSAEYGAKQAVAVLDEWFQEKEVSKVELKKVTDLQGELSVTFRAKGSDKAQTKTLLVTIEKKEKGEGYWLTRLELLP